MKHAVAIVTHAHVLQNFYTTWVRGVACQKQRLGPKLEEAGLGEHPKIRDPLHISATVEASNFKFGTQLGFGTSLPKTTFCTKIGGGLGQGSIQKIWDPYLFLQLLKIAISNLVHKLGLGLAYQKTTLWSYVLLFVFFLSLVKFVFLYFSFLSTIVWWTKDW